MPELPVYDPESLPDLLPIYYKKLFPFDQYYKWLSYGNGKYLISISGIACSSAGCLIL